MYSTLPKRLKAARIKNQLTQRQLGVRLGMDENTASARMNQYEKGKHSPDYQTMQRLAKVLDVPVAYFYCDDDLLAELVCAIAKQPRDKQEQLLKLLSGDNYPD